MKPSSTMPDRPEALRPEFVPGYQNGPDQLRLTTKRHVGELVDRYTEMKNRLGKNPNTSIFSTKEPTDALQNLLDDPKVKESITWMYESAVRLQAFELFGNMESVFGSLEQLLQRISDYEDSELLLSEIAWEELSSGLREVLQREGIWVHLDLTRFTEDTFADVRNLGEVRMLELRTYMAERGLEFA